MSGLFALLNLGANSVMTYQKALGAVSENVSNVSNPNYSRRVPVFEELPSYVNRGQYFSSGVDIKEIRRVIDNVLDRRLNIENSNSAFWNALNDVSKAVEVFFNENAGSGLSDALNGFFSAWQALATTPEGITERDQVVASATQLVDTVKSIDNSLQNVILDGVDRIKGWISEVNRLASDIANLNTQIRSFSVGKSIPNDLLDKLNSDLRELTELIGGYYTQKPDGTIQVFLSNGMTVVDGESAFRFDFNEGSFMRKMVVMLQSNVLRNDVEYEKMSVLSLQGEDVTGVVGGKIGGTIKGFVDVVDEVRARFNRLISELIYNVNRIHVTGMGVQKIDSLASSVVVTDPKASLTSQKNIYFPDRIQPGALEVRVWDSQGNIVTSKTIGISLDEPVASIVAKLDLIDHINAFISSNGQIVIRSDQGYYFSFYNDTSGFLTAFGLNTFFIGDSISNFDLSPMVRSNHLFVASGKSFDAGDNTVALEIAGLSSKKSMEGGLTFGQYYENLVGELGTTIKRIGEFMEDSNKIVEQLNAKRESISGVNLDEEFVNLIKYQRAFQASVRYITVIDEMLQTIVSTMGVAGR